VYIVSEALAGRVRRLVDRVHGGSVNQAAKDVGIAQPTLARIVAGDVHNPRMAALSKLSAFYGATTDWLLTGAGASPEILDSSPSSALNHRNVVARWILMVRKLELPAPIEEVMVSLPSHTTTAMQLMYNLFPFDESTSEALNKAMVQEHEAWLTVLTAALRYRGEAGARELLIDHASVLKSLLPPWIGDDHWNRLQAAAKPSIRKSTPAPARIKRGRKGGA
jgi:transcriptional regulator with XRE-family HTH domain